MTKDLFLLPLLLLCVGAVGILQVARPQRPAIDAVTFAFNEGKPVVSPDVGKVASFGYSRALTSLLWVRFLQNTPPTKAPKGGSSWVYYDLEAISSLDPDFLPVYEMGALFLSVVTEDPLGAERILKRGAELHPDDYKILGALGYHYEFEMHDSLKAGPYFLAASKLPGAPYLYSLIAATYLNRTQSAQAGIDLLKGMLEKQEPGPVRHAIEEKIQKLEKEARHE